ncbi:lipopolysaccharide biosynthesis protein [Thalassotalea sp. ND16A]|uniref:lipopolysaccharide biosynthesis protein n=1 Tax=Thalassotalea sp. ND16A TaxID=1535422 RepID=UPI00051D8369|nr:lipopolysaccharide biosynthesis protein [Thalassotalea sp. ND16A]KGJ90196.1 hypothetical protein ND16A_2046 [Thalassotalea sp. ND16A]
MQDINRKITIGAVWNLVGLLTTHGSGMLFTLILASLLSPESFGLIAMATICFQLANAITQSGLGQAVIQSKSITEKDLNTVFYVNIAFSLITYALLFASAPYIASFYNQPELSNLLKVAGVVVVINALKVVQISILSRQMNFKLQTIANSLGMLISGGVAIYLAYCDFGVYALVAQMLVSSFVSTLFLWFGSAWRPSFMFCFESFKRLFSFGASVLAEGITGVLFQNSYILIIGRFFSVEVTGYYFIARKISSIIAEQLTRSVEQSAFPALSTLQENNENLRVKYRQIIQILMFVISPLLLFLSVCSPLLLEFILGEEWKPAGTYMQLLCLLGVLRPLHSLNVNLLLVKGYSNIMFKVGLVKKTINLILLFLTIPFGIKGIIIGQIVGSLIGLIPNTYYTVKLINYSLKEQLLDAIKPLLLAVIASCFVWLFITFLYINPLLKVIIATGLGAVIYILTSYLFKCEGFLLIQRKFSSRIKLPFNLSI